MHRLGSFIQIFGWVHVRICIEMLIIIIISVRKKANTLLPNYWWSFYLSRFTVMIIINTFPINTMLFQRRKEKKMRNIRNRGQVWAIDEVKLNSIWFISGICYVHVGLRLFSLLHCSIALEVLERKFIGVIRNIEQSESKAARVLSIKWCSAWIHMHI